MLVVYFSRTGHTETLAQLTGATVLEGLAVKGDEVGSAGPAVTAWLASLGWGGRFGLADYNTREVVDELNHIEQNVEALPVRPEARVLVTGSTAGLGELKASMLIAKGHRVVVHARNDKRAEQVRRDLPGAEAVVIGDLRIDNLLAGDPAVSYSDSKLQVTALAMALARKWPDVKVNAVHPGWVPTQMGGVGAPDDLREGYLTQVWLAEATEPDSDVTGGFLFHRQPETSFNPIIHDAARQDALLDAYQAVSGVELPS
ncbi:MAG: SDR family NAD(P)-dependent oxidoreductase [Bifidobacteriaceae bacterium]|nr:SDR family NAD(P)-dependent oxidoreductase [Bifidobacteriaceae bacterium]